MEEECEKIDELLLSSARTGVANVQVHRVFLQEIACTCARKRRRDADREKRQRCKAHQINTRRVRGDD